MQTVQVVMEDDLLQAADEAAKADAVNRSELIRKALRVHLKQRKIERLEREEQEAYERMPDTADDLVGWEDLGAWPDDE